MQSAQARYSLLALILLLFFGAVLALRTFNSSKADYLDSDGISHTAVNALWNVLDDPLISEAEYRRSGLTLYNTAGAGSVRNAGYDSAHASNILAMGTPDILASDGQTVLMYNSCLIEEQRFSADAIQAGLHAGKTTFQQQGEKYIQWGFAHQGSDGGFPCSEVVTGGVTDLGGAYHSTSFFAESTARALLNYAHQSDAASQTMVETYLPKLQAITKWELRPDVAAAGKSNNAQNFHRRWLLAAGFAETAALTNPVLAYSCPGKAAITTLKECLLSAAQDMVQDALTNGEVITSAGQGYFKEKGPGGYGYDLSYNMVGMHFADNFLAVWPTDTVPRAAFATAAMKGLTDSLGWSIAHLYDHNMTATIGNPDDCSQTISHTFVPGEADMTGSTRVYWCTSDVAPSGQIKKFDYHMAFYALEEAFKLTQNPLYNSEAYTMADAVVAVSATSSFNKSSGLPDKTTIPLGLCVDPDLTANSQTKLTTAVLTYKDTQNGASAASVTVSADSAGKLNIPALMAFPSNTNFSVLLHSNGYLNHRVNNVYATTAGCRTLSSADGVLVPGDLNNDNKISILDITSAIHAYTKDPKATDTTQIAVANTLFGGSTSLGNVVTIIRGSNTDFGNGPWQRGLIISSQNT